MASPRPGATLPSQARNATPCVRLPAHRASAALRAGHGPRPLSAVGRGPVRVTAQVTTSKPKLYYAGARKQRALSAPFPTLANGRSAALAPLSPPVMSKSDMAFHDEGFDFVYSSEGLDVKELNTLFERVGFPRRDERKLQVALENSHSMVWVHLAGHDPSDNGPPPPVVGFARAVTGGRPQSHSATIWDVAVNPAYQGLGLGRGLMERLTAGLVEDDISSITLFAEPTVVGLYEKLGYAHCPPNSAVHSVVHHDRLHSVATQHLRHMVSVSA